MHREKKCKDFYSTAPATNLRREIDGLYTVYITTICS